jgi:outer membrane lipoprotein-sorting protein
LARIDFSFGANDGGAVVVALLRNRVILSFILFFTLLLAMVGCSKDVTTQEIVDKTSAAMSQVNSYKFNPDIILTTSGGVVDKTAGSMTIHISGEASVDVAKKQTAMNLTIDQESTGQTKVSIPASYYLIDNAMYLKINVPFLGDKWLKSTLDYNSPVSQDLASQQIKMLAGAVDVTLLGKEDVVGVSCYVLQFTPDLTAIGALLSSLQRTADLSQIGPGNIDPSKIDLNQLIKNVTVKLWVAIDKYWIEKSTASFSLDTASLSAGTDSTATFKVDFQVNGQFSGFNQSVQISLPADAQNASDISDISGK